MAGMISRKLKKHGPLAKKIQSFSFSYGSEIYAELEYLLVKFIFTTGFCSLGVSDRELSLLGSRKNANVGNSCRNLHRFVAKTGKRLDVKVQPVNIKIRKVTKAKVHEVNVDHPTLPLSAWMQTSFDLGGHFFLGGKNKTHFSDFSKILDGWWRAYKAVDPNLPFFDDFGEEYYRTSFPIAIHGDEGRGRYKRPIMVIGYQPLITNFDGQSNLKGSGMSKFLF